MKLNTQALALMTALAAGLAGAQQVGDGTLAGTTINNTATATFTDPTQPSTAPQASVNSNTVSTTVLPKPGFDTVYRDGTDGAEGSTTGGNTASSAKSTAILAPGGTLETPYYLLNNGNTAQTITLSSNTTGSTVTPTVAYYLDTDGDGILSTAERGAGPVSQISLPYDNPSTTADEGRVAFIQVLTSPTTAPAASISAASPVASGQGFDASNSTVISNQTESTAVLGLQFATITTLTPSITNDPNSTTTTTPLTTTVTAPGSTTPAPGYTSGTTPIVVNGDQQLAYPKADSDTTSDTVTFTNTVNNTGTNTDPVNLFPTDSSGNPIGTMQPDGTFTNIPGLPTGTTVQFLDANGTPLPIGKDGLPVLQAVAGQETNYQTKITYPDSNSMTDPAPITVLIGVDSGLDAGTTSNDTTTNVIYPPAAQFGDTTTAVGTSPTPEVIKSGTPGATVSFPMDVANLGEYTDSFNLSGTVQIPLTDGTTTTVNVVYYLDTNGNGTVDAGETAVTNTGNVVANSEVKLVAVVTIPAGALATVVGSEPTLQQTATGQYSTIVMTDTNDKINVTPAGSMAVAKFVQGGNGETSISGLTAPSGYAGGSNSALPGAKLNYVIMAKNNYNIGVANFTLSDRVPANTTYVSSTCTLSTGAACKTFINSGVIYTDLNGDGVVSAADVLPQGATVTLTMNVTVN